MAECEKGPVPGLTRGTYLDEAVVSCPLPWLGQVQKAAPSTGLKGPPPTSLAPSCLCSQALAELSSMEVPPGTEPGDAGGWGRGARADSGPRPCPDPHGRQARGPSSPIMSLCPSSLPLSRAQLAVQKYEDLFPAFSDSREYKLMKVSAGAFLLSPSWAGGVWREQGRSSGAWVWLL